jgi:drug/metabolite transporter (DMT)-like permease
VRPADGLGRCMRQDTHGLDPTTASPAALPTVDRAEPPQHPARGWLSWLEQHRSARVGVLMLLASCGLLTVGDAAVKWLTVTYPIGQVICIRGLIILVCLIALHGASASTHLRPRHPGAQAWRALFFVASTFLMVWSFKLLPLPTVAAVSFTSPLIITALAPFVLGEHVGWRRWLAVCIGFLGVLVIVNPRAGVDWVMLVPIAAAVCAAARDLATRSLAGRETSTSLVFIAMAATVVAGATTAPFGWVMPRASDWMLFLLLGAAHGAAYFLHVGAFRAAEAGLLAPFKYSLLLWAIVVAFLIWGHLPSVTMLAGAAIVIGSGIYIWQREFRAGTARA